MAEKIGNDLENHGVQIQRPAVPTKVNKLRAFW